MKKKLILLIKKLFAKKTYTSKTQRIGYRKSTKQEVYKDIDEQIKNASKEIDALIKAEEKRAMEIKVLTQIIKEDPYFYTEEEYLIILDDLSKK